MKRVTGYFKSHVKRKIIYDTRISSFSEYELTEFNWIQCYLNAIKEFPPDILEPKDKPVVVNGYLNASYPTCLVIRQFITHILLFISNTPIEWYS